MGDVFFLFYFLSLPPGVCGISKDNLKSGKYLDVVYTMRELFHLWHDPEVSSGK